MKTSRLALALLTCATSSVFAQDSSPQCGFTNFDQNQDHFTVINPARGALNQQCFLTVHAASAALPAGIAGRFTEGNYEILLSGGGGGGGGGGSSNESNIGSGGEGGKGAVPARSTQYLSPGVYRLAMGTGGLGGGASQSENAGGNGAAGNPSGMTEAYTGRVIAGFPGAEHWAGYSREHYQVASGRGGIAAPSSAVSDGSGFGAVNGANGQNRDGPAESGFQGGHGFIKLTQLSQAAPQGAAPAVIPQAPAPQPVLRPMRKDRN